MALSHSLPISSAPPPCPKELIPSGFPSSTLSIWDLLLQTSLVASGWDNRECRGPHASHALSDTKDGTNCLTPALFMIFCPQQTFFFFFNYSTPFLSFPSFLNDLQTLVIIGYFGQGDQGSPHASGCWTYQYLGEHPTLSTHSQCKSPEAGMCLYLRNRQRSHCGYNRLILHNRNREEKLGKARGYRNCGSWYRFWVLPPTTKGHSITCPHKLCIDGS